MINPFKDHLTSSGYFYDESSKIWSRLDFEGISYSDGGDVENRIFRILKNSSDLSSLSDELKLFCTDWPSTYHLSSSRANILRPFERDLTGDVLEIGSGCGAITRYLGECGGNVLALEGTARRALISRTRTRDLDNVTVISEPFQKFQINRKFDVITLIGVLEYSGLYVSSDNPASSMLKKIKKLLKPNGKLIIAIENQLGLKYFAGAPEDHIGKPFFGIENHYTKNHACTYGRYDLNTILTTSGFSNVEFFAPFPDYKFPTSIITERGLNDEFFDASYFITQTVRNDPQIPKELSFSPQLAWNTILKNKMAMDLTNSFLILAGNKKNVSRSDDIIAYHYSSSRAKNLCKSTIFKNIKKNKISVISKRLDSDSRANYLLNGFKNKIISLQDYHKGHLLLDDFNKVLAKDNWNRNDLKFLLTKYISILQEIMGFPLSYDQNIPIDGKYIDCTLQNLIAEEESFIFFDKEWIFEENISLGYLLFRSLFGFISQTYRLGKTNEKFKNNFIGFFHFSTELLEWKISRSKLIQYIKLEHKFQKSVSATKLSYKNFYSRLNTELSFLTNLEYTQTQLNIRSKEREILAEKINYFSNWAKFVSEKRQAQIEENNRLNSNFIFRNVKRFLLRKKSLKEFLISKIKKDKASKLLPNIPQKLLTSFQKEKKLIVVFPIITWDFRWQRPQQILSKLIDQGYTVLYIAMSLSPIGRKFYDIKDAEHNLKFNKLADNCFQVWLSSFSELNLYEDEIKSTNLHNIGLGLEAVLSKIKPNLIHYYINLPGWWPVVKNLNAKHKGNIIFDCMDDHSGFSTNSIEAIKFEKDLTVNSNLVIASSNLLNKKCKKLNKNTILVKNATDVNHFNSPIKNGKLDDFLGKPLIGYFGAISDWFDLSIIEYCASKKPDWNFILIGSMAGSDSLEKLSTFKNVLFMGEIPYDELPGYYAYFDVCMIPFKKIPLTMATNPVKFYEYISDGKPVVSVDLPELLPYLSCCYIAKDKHDFLVKLILAFRERSFKDKISQRKALAMKNSWSSRVNQIEMNLKKLN
jgi:SAM-dependent methyltransferase